MTTELRDALAAYAAEKRWPITPDQLWFLLALRQADEAGILPHSPSVELAEAGIPRLAYLALGPVMANLAAEASDMIDLWLDGIDANPEINES